MKRNYLYTVLVLIIFTLTIGCTQETDDDKTQKTDITDEQSMKNNGTSPNILEVENFTLPDQFGDNVTLSDYSNKVVVLEWINPDCPFVQRHYKEETMTKLENKFGKDVLWLAINSTHYMEIQDNKEWAETYNLSYQILDDNAGHTGRAYDAKTTPHMFIIHDGKLVYEGAIDDDKFGKKPQNERINYVENALMQISSDNPVDIAQTKPYGCSVKYKN